MFEQILPTVPRPKDQILRLRVAIDGILPPIYRKIDVPNTLSFAQLHDVLQIAFDWHNCHLYEFVNGQERIGEEEADIDSSKLLLKERLYLLGQKIFYIYDFGDYWEHIIEVEKIFDADLDKFYPACVSGKLNAPPEDVGGMPGFEDFVNAMEDEEHPSHEEFLEWYGEYYDSSFFSRKTVNDQLKKMI